MKPDQSVGEEQEADQEVVPEAATPVGPTVQPTVQQPEPRRDLRPGQEEGPPPTPADEPPPTPESGAEADAGTGLVPERPVDGSGEDGGPPPVEATVQTSREAQPPPELGGPIQETRLQDNLAVNPAVAAMRELTARGRVAKHQKGYELPEPHEWALQDIRQHLMRVEKFSAREASASNCVAAAVEIYYQVLFGEPLDR